MNEECTCSPYELLHVRSKSCKYHSADDNYSMETIFPAYSEIEIPQQRGVKFILSPFEKLLYSPTNEEREEINRKLRDGGDITEILDAMIAHKNPSA